MQPFFTLITPVLNGQNHINSFVESLSSQVFVDWECLLIDDGSTDDTFMMLEAVVSRDPRFKLHVSKYSKIIKGPYSARNFGMDHALGQFFCFFDIDDFWYPSYLQILFEAIAANPGSSLITSPYFRSSDFKTGVLRNPSLFWPPNSWIRFFNVIPMLSTSVASTVVKDIRFLPVYHEDYCFWYEVLSRLNSSNCLLLDSPLSVYRISSSSQSGSKYLSFYWALLIFWRRHDPPAFFIINVMIWFFYQAFLFVVECLFPLISKNYLYRL